MKVIKIMSVSKTLRSSFSVSQSSFMFEELLLYFSLKHLLRLNEAFRVLIAFFLFTVPVLVVQPVC